MAPTSPRTRLCPLPICAVACAVALLSGSVRIEARPSGSGRHEPAPPPQIQVYQAETTKLNPPAGGPCVPAEPPTRYEGTARNGQYQGHMDLEVRRTDSARGALAAKIAFSDGLVGDGSLEGTLAGADLTLGGQIRSFPGGDFRMQIRGRVAGNSMTGSYTLSRSDGSSPQQGQFTLTGHTGVDTRIVGAWAMFVPGAVASYEHDRGSYLERVTQVSHGTAGNGALVIDDDGQYSWTERGEKSRGHVSYCATRDGEAGWSLKRGREIFWARWVPGNRPGLFLFAPGQSTYHFQGTLIPANR